MVIRVQWRATGASAPVFPQLALALSSLLTPLALLAFSLAFWAFAAELQWANTFLFSETVFAHWQIWLALAALLVVIGQGLAKFAARENSIVRKGNPEFHSCLLKKTAE